MKTTTRRVWRARGGASLLGLFLLWLSSSLVWAEEAKMIAAGKREFARNCAMCHGAGGRGDGVMATLDLLTNPPPNLTRISKRHNGAFPFSKIYRIIDGRTPVEGYNTPDMPIWGEAFLREASATPSAQTPEAEERVKNRILALVYYLQTIQEGSGE